MRRVCPACGHRTVPWMRLMLVYRTTCNHCNARLGLRRLFAAVLYVAIFVLFFLAARWVLARFHLVLAATVLVALFLIAGGTAARFGPLEAKSKRHSP